MADGRHLEKLKNDHIPASVHAINTEFGMLMHIGPTNRSSSQNFQLLKIQDGGRRYLKKLKNGHDSQWLDRSALNWAR